MNNVAPSAPTPAGPDATLNQQIIHDTLAQASHLMEQLVETTRQDLQKREEQSRTPGERHALLEARQQLMRLAPVMCERYPAALRKALQPAGPGQAPATRSLFTVHFDDLELMDESQISDSVERARAGQVVAAAVESPLAELDALVCAALGLPTVTPERNPLRPDLFLQALQTVVTQMQVTDAVRRDWMLHIASALGHALRNLYGQLIARLQQGGIQPVGYAVRQANGAYVYLGPTATGQAPGFGPETAPARLEAARPPAASTGTGDDSLLTLDRLRRLLLGELSGEPAQPARSSSLESFAEQFSRTFEHPDNPAAEPAASDFDMTVPAAFEALQEMNQVGRMMERLGSQRPQAASHPALHGGTAGLGQALSMEVVALMVENITHDNRLLWPVQQIVKALEPALLQLALADPRFFSDRGHPARRLLQEITDRSLAFDSLEAPGFESFMQPLIDTARPLATARIDGKEPFEDVLQRLQATWAAHEQARERERLRAIEALRHAEQRHLLAATLARDIWLLPQIGLVPQEISKFLLGPWTQVMAQARLADENGGSDPGRYRELVDALLWSAQPELTRLNAGQLARLVPKLLSRLREGLSSIDYPAAKTAAFFDLLMQLHQQAFKPAPGTGQRAAPPPTAQKARPQPAPHSEDEPWIAPSEAKESGYMESNFTPESQGTTVAPMDASHSAPQAMDTTATPAANTTDPDGLAVGTWVDLLVAGKWERTQLSWIGSHGNLFLFTSASGRTQSMTRRLLDKLIEQGSMRVVSQQTVVEGALDAVAQTAMRNSVDVRL